MQLIPAGSITIRDFVDHQKWISEDYSMSIPGAKKGLEERITTVEIAAFYMAEFTVTEALYASVMGIKPSIAASEVLPVVNVSWREAIAFCNAFSELQNLTPCYSWSHDWNDVTYDQRADGYRLPTCAEWQYACKGGTSGYRYGNIDDIAWYADNAEDKLHAVGQKAPNPWGLYDMLGNVWEWCWDLYDVDRYGDYRVFCGGSWAEAERACGSTSRRRSQPILQIDDLGFRIARNKTLDRAMKPLGI